eukprot:108609-Amphidinium_carterae.1
MTDPKDPPKMDSTRAVLGVRTKLAIAVLTFQRLRDFACGCCECQLEQSVEPVVFGVGRELHQVALRVAIGRAS